MGYWCCKIINHSKKEALENTFFINKKHDKYHSQYFHSAHYSELAPFFILSGNREAVAVLLSIQEVTQTLTATPKWLLHATEAYPTS